MIDILKLTKKELFKAFSKSIIIAFICAMVLVVSFYGLLITRHEPKGVPRIWKSNYLNAADYKTYLAESAEGKDKAQLLNEASVLIYCVDHDITPIDNQSASHFVLEVTSLTALLSTCIILISCYLTTYEYSNHTLIRLAVTGKKRWKILCAKMLAILVCSLLYAFMFEVISIIAGWILFGYDDFSKTIVFFEGSKIVERNVLVQVFINLGYSMVSFIAISALAILIAIITKSNIFGMATCMGVMIIGKNCYNFLYSMDWIKYTLFANTDFSRFLRNEICFENFTPLMSLGVLLVHTTVFVVLSFVIFNKRDITK